MKRVGFIGLGNMGGPMANNLVKAGYSIVGYDRVEAACAAAAANGVQIVDNAQAAVSDSDLVITMLPDGPILRSVYAEIVPSGRSGSCFIDCSTVDVESARAAHQMAADAGLLSIDAPVSGGIGGATAGTLTFMAGGSEDAFAAAQPLFDVMGHKAVHCGTAGAGQSAKIVNNMILGISMIGVCEAINLADKLELDREAMFDVVSTSSGYCWSMNAYCPAPGVGPQSPSDNDYKPGFAAALMLKDLKLSQQAAEATNAPTPLGAHATKIYDEFVADGGGNIDFSGMLPRFMKMDRE